MVDVFEQVEEELRSDRYKRLARTWLPVAGGVLLAALIAALAFWGWDSYQSGRAAKASVAYDRGMEALQGGDTRAADAAFTEAVDVGNGAYKALALNQRAGLAVTANRTADAVELFDEAARAAKDPLLADMAALKAAFLVMDTATLADVEARLEPLTADDRPFRAYAQEALGLARLQNGKTAEARELFVLLTLGQGVPDTLRQRAQAAISAIDNGSAASLAGIVRAAAALPPPTPGPAQAPGQGAPPQPAPSPAGPAQQ